ncbi:MAG: hypothetical protein DRJ42_13550 [Deltaproteobacteria bacterium]|nr:MAG: hypothetical protein DRJ42_13550 [Deltaproteobacteria bacterium]
MGLLALWLGACAPADFEIDANFPSEETFLWTEFGRIVVFEIAEPGQCPGLINEVETGSVSSTVILDTGQAPICEFPAGRIGFDEIPDELLAFVFIGSNEANLPLLHGCRELRPYRDTADGGTIQVRLTPHPVNYAAHAIGTPDCSSIMAKCGGGCP